MAIAPLSTASQPAVIGGGASANPVRNQPALTLEDLTAPSNDPNISINATTQTGALQFPADRPHYYFQIDLAKYNRSSWDSAGTISTQMSIVLPLPQIMIDSQQVEWDTVPLGMFGAGALNASRGNFGGQTLKDIATNGIKQGGAAVGADVLANAGPIGQGFLAAAGVAVNQFLTIMLKGPTYRELDFNWQFAPQTAAESVRILNIIALINDAAAPSLVSGLGSAFFGYPYIFNCSFHCDNAPLGGVTNGLSALFNFKPAVVRNRAWNYTGGGQPAHFAGTRAPAIIDFHLKLVELEFWLAGQYGSNLTPFNGTAFTQTAINYLNTVAELTGQKIDQINQGGTNVTPAPPKN